MKSSHFSIITLILIVTIALRSSEKPYEDWKIYGGNNESNRCLIATPATYQANGKQYVVIACGGGKMGTKSGDSYVAFGLK